MQRGDSVYAKASGVENGYSYFILTFENYYFNNICDTTKSKTYKNIYAPSLGSKENPSHIFNKKVIRIDRKDSPILPEI